MRLLSLTLFVRWLEVNSNWRYHMGWKLIQGSIIVAFIFHNHYVGWSENRLVPVVFGWFTAYSFTLTVNAWADRLRGRRKHPDMTVKLPLDHELIPSRALGEQELGHGRVKQRLGK